MSAAPEYHLDEMTPDEYLAFDHTSETKHEYVDGSIVAMAGASDNHSLIVMFTGIAMGLALRGGPCVPRSPDTRVGVPNGNHRYPDMTVTCGEAQLEQRKDNIPILLNPTLIVEVLSPSTMGLDLGEKRIEYQQIPSLQAYLIIWQDQALAELFQRQGDIWVRTLYTGREATLTIDSLSIMLALADVYAEVLFENEGSPDE